MEHLTKLIGFDARYIIYPVIALLVAGVIKFIIHHYLRKWAERTESKIDDHVVNCVDGLITPLLLISILYFVSIWLPLAAAKIRYIQKGLIVTAILLVVLYSAKLVSTILATIQTIRQGWQRFLQPLRMLSNVLFVLIGIALSLKALDINLSDEGVRFVRIIGIIIGAYVLLKIINLAVVQMERLVEDDNASGMSEAEKRARTLGKIINSAAFVLVVGVATMMILSEFGMNIAPIITGAGIAGLAVGFGAQNLVRDLIGGFFLILEDQIRVGDVVKINGTGGSVEVIRLRTTVLRDLEGAVHIFPNGEIKEVSNLTKEFSYFVLNVGIAYRESVDDVMKVLKTVGDDLAKDPNFSAFVLEPIEILGVDSFDDSQVTIKVRMKTLPLKQWMVGRELRRRIKNTFDSLGIQIPFPHVSVCFGEASKPFQLAMQSAARDAGGKKQPRHD
jgi:moderate conductance mechanosensitive channel